MENFIISIGTISQYKDVTDFELKDKNGYKIFDEKFYKTFIDKYESKNSAYTNIAPISPVFGKIISISMGYTYIEKDGSRQFREKTLYNDNEKELLSSFNNIIKKIEDKPYNLIGYNIVNFDIPYLYNRMLFNKILPSKLLDILNKKPWELRCTDISTLFGNKSLYLNLDEILYGFGVDVDILDNMKITEDYYNGNYDTIKNKTSHRVKKCKQIIDILSTINQ